MKPEAGNRCKYYSAVNALFVPNSQQPLCREQSQAWNLLSRNKGRFNDTCWSLWWPCWDVPARVIGDLAVAELAPECSAAPYIFPYFGLKEKQKGEKVWAWKWGSREREREYCCWSLEMKPKPAWMFRIWSRGLLRNVEDFNVLVMVNDGNTPQTWSWTQKSGTTLG